MQSIFNSLNLAVSTIIGCTGGVLATLNIGLIDLATLYNWNLAIGLNFVVIE